MQGVELVMSKPVRIYIDHGEAYGNLGEEAILLNALWRLERFMGPCEFILPAVPGKPLPEGLPRLTTVLPPHIALARWAKVFRLPFAAVRRIPLLRRLFPMPDSAYFWRCATHWANFKMFLLRLGIVKSAGKNLQPFLSTIKSCDAFYGVGAAAFSDCWLPGVVYKCWLYCVVRPFVRVSAVSSQGIGPLETKWALRMMKRSFEKLDFLSFRDHSLSQSIVENEKPANVRYKMVGDEALTLPTERDKASDLLRGTKLPEGRSFIAVHFRGTDFTQDTRCLVPRIAGILDQIALVVPHYFIFFPMSYHQHSGLDEEIGSAIRNHMVAPDRFLIAPTCKDVRAVKAAVGMARYSLGLSYHLHLFCLSQGRPSIIVYTGKYYRCKSEGLVALYGGSNAALDLERTGDAQIVSTVRNVENSYEGTCEAICRVNEELLKRNHWMVEEMAGVIRRSSQLAVKIES